MKRPLLFMDGEFTKLTTKGVKFLSLAFITEDNKELYLEIKQPVDEVDKWVKDNVMIHLDDNFISEELAKEKIIEFLKENDLYFPDPKDANKRPVIVADVNQFDWNGLCELFGVWEIPFFYIPIDFSTVLYTKGIDIDVDRIELAKEKGIVTAGFKKHNALMDTKILKLLWEVLMRGDQVE